MSMLAFTRSVPESIANTQLTYIERKPIDLERARRQHRKYQQTLADLGCTVHELPSMPESPDSVFVEDTAVVLDEIAIITRPGAESRRPETASVAEMLGKWRTLASIEAPGSVDGGDVLRIGARIFIGETERTNADGIEQFRAIVTPYGYEVFRVPLAGCLHLKSAVTALDTVTVLLNPNWVDPDVFADYRRIKVDPEESFAANVLLVGGRVLISAAAPRTRQRVEQARFRVTPVDTSELAKAEGALTCCSLIVSE